jgi:MFS family permease
VTVFLATAGLGLGAFTPANNAAIMASAPTHHSGMAGGILNLTRGLGTSLGVALAGLLLGLRAAQRASAPSAAVTSGFQLCLASLAVIAATAALLAALRGRPGQDAPPSAGSSS